MNESINTNADTQTKKNNPPCENRPDIDQTDGVHSFVSIGKFLKKEREDKNLSVGDISKLTKITGSMLEQLEHDNLDQLPNKAYVEGYIKSYAKELGLPQEECLNRLQKTYEIFFSPDLSSGSMKTLSRGNTTSTAARFLLFIIVIGAITTAGFLTYNKYSKLSDSRASITTQSLNSRTPLKIASKIQKTTVSLEKITLIPAIKTQVPPATNTNESPATFNTLENPATPQVKDDNVLEAKETIQPIKKIEPEKVVAVKEKKEDEKKQATDESKVKFSPVPYPLYSLVPNPSKRDMKYLPRNIARNADPKKQNLYIQTTSSDTWLTYKKDGENVKKIFLKKGKGLLIRGELIRIFFGNIRSTKLYLNNLPVNARSKSGVKSLVVPQKHSSKFKLPLFIFNKDGTVTASDEYISKLKN